MGCGASSVRRPPLAPERTPDAPTLLQISILDSTISIDVSVMPVLRDKAATLAEAATHACGLPAEKRLEHIGHYLMAKAEGGVLPPAP